MNSHDFKCFLKQYFRLIGIPDKKRSRIIEILGYCKEIRDTAYPLKNSLTTELKIIEFTANRDKDIYTVNGILQLKDGGQVENRTFEANIIESPGEVKVYLDITRQSINGKKNLIRTSDSIFETSQSIITVTRYYSSKEQEDIYTDELLKISDPLNNIEISESQLSISV